jgi:hypothetical protein
MIPDMPSAAFVRFWRTDLTRECFLSYVAQDDLQALRLASRDTAGPVAPYLFADVKVNFNTNSFSRSARLRALESIGQHVKTFTFNMPHTPDTFLPPLIDPISGIEQKFCYEPSLETSRPSSSSSRLSAPKYGSWDMNDLLIKQYPPLFHAATNIPSFVRAIAAMPSLRHLRVSCPGQDSNQRYRKSIVDYSLISMRIALEHVCPNGLQSIFLQDIHPSALQNLCPAMSIGSNPRSTKIWRRITTLTIEMEAWPFALEDKTDHLKLLHAYLQSLPSLTTLNFTWLGATKGPLPLSLNLEPSVTHPAPTIPPDSQCPPVQSEFSSKTPSHHPALRPLRLPRLTRTRITNATLSAFQAADFPLRHRRTLTEFDYANCTLRSGTWDDALQPLVARCRGSRRRVRTKAKALGNENEVMDVPIVFSGSEEDIGFGAATRTTSRASRPSVSASASDESECVREHLWETPEGEGRKSLWPLPLVWTRKTKGLDGLKRLWRCKGNASASG